MKYFIENEFIRLGCQSLGGCLCSIYDKRDKEELLYQPEPNSWQGQDVAIFPFIARLKGKTYAYKGKRHSLRNHGICRYQEFDLVEKTPTSMKLSLRSNDETMEEYPFRFCFEITYRLLGTKVVVSYDVHNIGEERMPFGIGAHPAFHIPFENGDTAGSYIIFDKKTELTRIVFDEKGEFIRGEEGFGIKDRIETRKELFTSYQTLCVCGEGLNHIRLQRKDGRQIEFDYDTIRYLVLWSFPESGSFVAIEPWMSLPDYEDAKEDILTKKTLLHLDPGKEYFFSYRISL